MRRALVSYSRPIRFDGKSVNRGLPVLDQARALDPCHRPEGSWALGTRMILSALHLAFYADAARARRAIFLPREHKVNVTFGEPLVSEVGGFYFRNCTVTARKCIDGFTHLVASWVIRANLQRNKAVHLFWFHIWSRNKYCSWRIPFSRISRFTIVFEPIE